MDETEQIWTFQVYVDGSTDVYVDGSTDADKLTKFLSSNGYEYYVEDGN